MLKSFPSGSPEFAVAADLPSTIERGTAESSYRDHMAAIHNRIAQILPGVAFSVGSIGFGPDYPGMVTVSIQGEFVEQAKTILPADVMVCALTHDEYGHIISHRAGADIFPRAA